jgi:hypothetical protein
VKYRACKQGVEIASAKKLKNIATLIIRLWTTKGMLFGCHQKIHVKDKFCILLKDREMLHINTTIAPAQ